MGMKVKYARVSTSGKNKTFNWTDWLIATGFIARKPLPHQQRIDLS